MTSVKRVFCALLLFTMVRSAAAAATWYVTTSGNDGWAGTSWATAKQTIQAAVDLTAPGDTVLVSNGLYATGGRVVYGTTTNRVAITNAIAVMSANGPAVTIIWGKGPIVGDPSRVRCVYVGSNAVLSGFTLTNGTTSGGSDPRDGRGGGALCEASSLLTNCLLTGNSSSSGGGSYGGVLRNCTLSGNSASGPGGGGAYTGRLINCTLKGNSADYDGGGASCSVLSNCTVSANHAYRGGGIAFSTLANCTLSDNTAVDGGGSSYCTLNNCLLTGNSADRSAGGSLQCTLNNCTLTGNSAGEGGGVVECTNNNCIVYFNTASCAANHEKSIFNFSCTTPGFVGTGNITNDPGLASASHLAADSSCIGMGCVTSASGTDIDGESWLNPPSMGCDEAGAGSITGTLTVSAWVACSNAAVGFPVPFRARISGRTTASTWRWGDGSISSNQPYAAHAFPSGAVYAVVLRAYNGSYPVGMAATVTVNVATQVVHYVKMGSAAPVSPYTSWATAATNIQDAISTAVRAGDLVLVSNGVYARGGRAVYGTWSNRVAITNAVIVKSVNGPSVTFIDGSNLMRCVYVGSNAVLSGFTLTNGAARAYGGDCYREECGGGAWCEVSARVTNCALTGGSAGSAYGGGVVFGTLVNCTLEGNFARYGGGSSWSTLTGCTLHVNTAIDDGAGSFCGTLVNCTISSNATYEMDDNDGGGVWGCTLTNCVLTDNSASYGGGSYECTMYNCTLMRNAAFHEGGASYRGTLYNCALVSNTTENGNGGGSSLGTLTRCILAGNSAFFHGGGAHADTLANCTLIGNSAGDYGGGAYVGYLYNCTLVGNSADEGGGAYGCNLFNCILYSNIAPSGTNYSVSALIHSCATPSAAGEGNITNDPQFVNAALNNFHLANSSPCVDRGTNEYVRGTTDLDGNPRIVRGIVDMGAYEFQCADGYGTWIGAITNGLTNLDDCATGDGYPNLLKYATGSSPTNSDEFARLLCGHGSGLFSLFNRNTNAVDVTLIVEGASSVSNGATWSGIATNINGSWGGATNVAETGATNPVTVTVQDPNPASGTNRFIRLRVSRP